MKGWRTILCGCARFITHTWTDLFALTKNVLNVPVTHNWWRWICHLSVGSLPGDGWRTTVVCFALVVFATESNASSVHLTGSIHYQNVEPDGRSGTELKSNFEVNLSSNLWMIRMVPRGLAATNLLGTECWFDGSTIYYLTRWDTNSAPLPRAGARSLGFASVNLQMNTRNVPPFDRSLCFPVWLAFASENYFHGDELIGPLLRMGQKIDFVPEEPRLTRVIAQYRSLANELVPESLRFLNIGKYAVVLPDATNIVAYRPPLDKGFLEGEYKVTMWNTNGGMKYPAESEFTLYTFQESKQPPAEVTVVPFIQMRLSLRQCEINNREAVFQPVIPAGQMVRIADYRTKIEGKALVYISTNGIAKPGTNFDKMVGKITRFEKERQAKLGARLRPSRSGVQILIISAGGVSMMVLMFLCRRFSNKNI